MNILGGHFICCPQSPSVISGNVKPANLWEKMEPGTDQQNARLRHTGGLTGGLHV